MKIQSDVQVTDPSMKGQSDTVTWRLILQSAQVDKNRESEYSLL
jgi:hypothetical protein